MTRLTQLRKLLDVDQAAILNLPHGSGINYDWYCEKHKDGKIVCFNRFDVMNEHGFYIGAATFSICWYLASEKNFRLQFHGRRAQYLNQYYNLREYLEDTIYNALLNTRRDNND